MLRMVTSDFRHTPMANFGMSYLPSHKELKAIYGPCLLSSHGSPEGGGEAVGLSILCGNKQTGRNFQGFPGIRKEPSMLVMATNLYRQHFGLIILGRLCETYVAA